MKRKKCKCGNRAICANPCQKDHVNLRNKQKRDKKIKEQKLQAHCNELLRLNKHWSTNVAYQKFKPYLKT